MAPGGHTTTPSIEPSQHGSTRRRLFFSFGAQSMAILIRVVVQLLLVPISLRGWGAPLYQDWILVSSAIGFLSILDLGMQVYFGNGLLSAWSRQDHAAYRRLLGTAFGLYGIVIGLSALALLGLSIAFPWSQLIGTTLLSDHELVLMLAMMGIAMLILIPTGLLTAIYRARGDYGLSTASSAIAEAARGVAVALVILAGGGPVPAAAVYLLVAVSFSVTVLFDQKRRYGELPSSPSLPSAEEFNEALSQSGRYLVAGMVTPVLQNAPILLLGRLGAEQGAVVAFSVFRTFTGIARQIVAQLSHGVGGELGQRHSRRDITGSVALMFHAGRLVSGSGGLLCAAVLFLARPFLAVWTRGEVMFDPWLCVAFLAPVMVTAPAQVSYMVFHYTNRPTVLVVAGALQVVATVLLCAALIGPLSAIGAALGCALAESLSIGLLLPAMATRSLAIPLSRYYRHCFGVAALCFAVSGVIAYGVERLLAPQNYAEIVLSGLIWSLAVAAPAFHLLLSRSQRQWVMLQLAALFVRLRP